MKVILNTSELLRATKLMSRVANSAKEENTTLGQMLIDINDEGLTRITASDMDNQISYRTSAILMSLAGAARFTLPVKQVLGVISLASADSVEIDVIEQNATLKCGKSKYKLRSSPGDDFPIVSEDGRNNRFCVGREELLSAITRGGHATSKDQTRMAFTCVSVEAGEELCVASCDTHVMASSACGLVSPPGEKSTALITEKTIKLLLSSIDQCEDVSCELNKNSAFFSWGTDAITTIVSRCLDSEYPNWRRIVDGVPRQMISVNRSELIRLLNRMGTIRQEDFSGNVMEMNVGEATVQFTVKGENGDAIEEVDIQAMGETFESLRISRTNVIGCLEPLRSENVWLGYKPVKKMLMVSDEDNSMAAIIRMDPPVKVVKETEVPKE